MYTFEIHITTSTLTAKAIQRFEQFCHTIKAKPIVIQLPKGQQAQQPMISKIIKTDSVENLNIAVQALEQDFLNANFPIHRTKIEVPFWDMIATQHFYKNTSKQYYEWHGKVAIEQEKIIKTIIQKYNGHLSKNTLKKDNSTKFITLRDYANDETNIQNRINAIKKELQHFGINIIKEELEFCIYDSNALLDKGWVE